MFYLIYFKNIILFFTGLIYFISIILLQDIISKNILFFLMDLFLKILNIIFFERIDKVNLLNQKINLVNSNHFNNIDWIILFSIFYKNKIYSNNITSISSIDNKNNFENKVFKFYDSIIIDRNTGTINNLEKQLVKFKNSTDKKYIICFFEGKSLNHLKNIPTDYLLKPKTGIFNQFSKIFKNKFFNDLTIIYLYKGKIMNPKDKYFILKLLSPECRIRVKNYSYKYPSNNIDKFLLNIYEYKKELLKIYL